MGLSELLISIIEERKKELSGEDILNIVNAIAKSEEVEAFKISEENRRKIEEMQKNMLEQQEMYLGED
jgi:CRISPR/Cas system-associated protein Csm6